MGGKGGYFCGLVKGISSQNGGELEKIPGGVIFLLKKHSNRPT